MYWNSALIDVLHSAFKKTVTHSFSTTKKMFNDKQGNDKPVEFK